MASTLYGAESKTVLDTTDESIARAIGQCEAANRLTDSCELIVKSEGSDDDSADSSRVILLCPLHVFNTGEEADAMKANCASHHAEVAKKLAAHISGLGTS